MGVIKELAAFGSAAFLLLAAGCASAPVQEAPAQEAYVPEASAPQAPLWVAGDVGAVYGRGEYLAAKGEGKSAELAEHDALHTLSQYFEAQVHAEGASQRTVTDGSFSSAAVLDVSVESNADLFCVEYETYYDEARGRYYCAAYINRERAFNFVRPKLEAARTRFPPAYYSALEDDSLLDKIIGIKNAQTVLPDFYEAYGFARAILPERARAYEAVDELAGESLLNVRELRGSVIIQIEGVGDLDLLERSGVVAALADRFARLGFIVGGPRKSNCIALVEVKSVITETRETFETYPEISIRVLERGAEKISYSKRLKKVAGFDRETAERRTNIALVQDVRTSFMEEWL